MLSSGFGLLSRPPENTTRVSSPPEGNMEATAGHIERELPVDNSARTNPILMDISI